KRCVASLGLASGSLAVTETSQVWRQSEDRASSGEYGAFTTTENETPNLVCGFLITARGDMKGTYSKRRRARRDLLYPDLGESREPNRTCSIAQGRSLRPRALENGNASSQVHNFARHPHRYDDSTSGSG